MCAEVEMGKKRLGKCRNEGFTVCLLVMGGIHSHVALALGWILVGV